MLRALWSGIWLPQCHQWIGGLLAAAAHWQLFSHPIRRQAFIFFLHCSPQAQLGLGSSDTTMDLRAFCLLLKLGVSRIENIYLNLAKSFTDTMFSWKFFFPFTTKLWGAFSRLLCWHFLLFVVNLLLVLNSCQYQIWYVIYSLLVLHYSLFIDIYTSVSMFNDGTCPAKQVWVSQSHLKQRGWKEIRILNFFRGSGDRLSSIKCVKSLLSQTVGFFQHPYVFRRRFFSFSLYYSLSDKQPLVFTLLSC